MVYNSNIKIITGGITMNLKTKTQNLTAAGVLAALLCVSAYISIPLGFTPTPLTLQTLAINLIAIMLAPSMSFMTVLVYILVGLVGVPVFSGGAGGPAKLFGPTGGYILAFLVSAPIMSVTKEWFVKLFGKFIKSETTAKIIGYAVNAVIVGMVIIYVIGSIYMKFMLGKSFGAVLMMAVVPFIPLDLLKCVLAAVIAVPVMKALNR